MENGAAHPHQNLQNPSKNLQNPSKKTDKVRRIIRPNGTTAVFTLEMDYSSETDNLSSKSVKIDGKTDG